MARIVIIYICSSNNLCNKMGSPLYKIVFLSYQDDVGVDTELIRDLPNEEIWPIVKFGQLQEYLDLFFPMTNYNSVRIITPHKLLAVKSDHGELHLITEYYTPINHHEYQRLLHRFSLLGPKRSSSINELILRSITGLIENELQIERTEKIEDLLNDQIKPSDLDLFIELLNFQGQILRENLYKQGQFQLIDQLHEIMSETENNVIRLLLATYLYRNTDLVSFEKMRTMLLQTHLTENDLALMDIFAPIYYKLSLKYPIEKLVLRSLDLINSAIAITSYFRDKVSPPTASYFYFSAGLISITSSTDISNKANIYNNLISQLKNNFDQSLVRYFFSLAYHHWESVIFSGKKHDKEQSTSFLYNYTDYFDTLHDNNRLIHYLYDILDQDNGSYMQLFAAWRVLNLLDLIDEKEYNQVEHKIIKHHCKIHEVLMSNSVDYLDVKVYLRSISSLNNLYQELDENHRFHDQIVFKQFKHSIKYYEDLNVLFDPSYEVAEIEKMVINLVEELKEEPVFVERPVMTILQKQVLIFLVQNLVEIDKNQAYRLLRTLGIFEIETNRVTPVTLLVNLIKAFFNEYKLTRVEIQYLQELGISMDRVEQNNSIIELIQEFYVYIQSKNSLQTPVMTIIDGTDGSQIILNMTHSVQSMSLSQDNINLQIQNYDNQAIIQYTINEIQRMQDPEDRIEMLQSISPLFDKIDNKELTNLRFQYPAIHDQISYYQELAENYFLSKNTAIALITIERGVDLAKSMERVRRSDWLDLVKKKIKYLDMLGINNEEDEEIVSLIEDVDLSIIPNLID